MTIGATTRPCVKCGSLERYKSGDCAPCARARAKRNGNDLAYIRDWQSKNREKVLNYKRKNRKKVGKEYHRLRNKLWRQKNRPAYLAINRKAANKRRLLVKQQKPKWANEAMMSLFYKLCPEGCVVDHIIPLKGETVCGLHTPENFQYLPANVNQEKYNFLIEDYFGEPRPEKKGSVH